MFYLCSDYLLLLRKYVFRKGDKISNEILGVKDTAFFFTFTHKD